MAEIKETAFTDSGYRPGRALSPEDYSGGFVDFYKDYLGTTGIKTTTPVDEEEEKIRKTLLLTYLEFKRIVAMIVSIYLVQYSLDKVTTI